MLLYQVEVFLHQFFLLI